MHWSLASWVTAWGSLTKVSISSQVIRGDRVFSIKASRLCNVLLEELMPATKVHLHEVLKCRFCAKLTHQVFSPNPNPKYVILQMSNWATENQQRRNSINIFCLNEQWNQTFFLRRKCCTTTAISLVTNITAILPLQAACVLRFTLLRGCFGKVGGTFSFKKKSF